MDMFILFGKDIYEEVEKNSLGIFPTFEKAKEAARACVEKYYDGDFSQVTFEVEHWEWNQFFGETILDLS